MFGLLRVEAFSTYSSLWVVGRCNHLPHFGQERVPGQNGIVIGLKITYTWNTSTKSEWW